MKINKKTLTTYINQELITYMENMKNSKKFRIIYKFFTKEYQDMALNKFSSKLMNKLDKGNIINFSNGKTVKKIGRFYYEGI